MKMKVLCSIGIQDAFLALMSRLEKHTGASIDVSFGIATVFKENIVDGAVFDVAILTRAIAEDLVKTGHIISPTVDIARSGLGLAVPHGAPKPKIATADLLKRTLLEAESIASSGNGLAGSYFMDVLAELGIAKQVQSKIKLDNSGGYAAQLAAKGEAQFAVQLVSEILPVSGVELVDSFPETVQKYAILSAGKGRLCQAQLPATALIEYLRSAAVTETFAQRGLERCI